MEIDEVFEKVAERLIRETTGYRKIMSRAKYYKPPFDDRNKAGEKICVMCGERLSGRQRCWCGRQECFNLYGLRKGDTDAIRRYVWDRYKGKCIKCGLDVKTLEEIKEIVQWPLTIFEYPEGKRIPYQKWVRLMQDGWTDSEWRRFLLRIGVKYAGFYDHLWEADHIIPIAEGGEHEEANLRLLCIKCHRGSTKKLMGRLGQKKKAKRISERYAWRPLL